MGMKQEKDFWFWALHPSRFDLIGWRIRKSFLFGAGESGITDTVIQESENQGQAARRFLEDVRLSFPQVILSSALCIRLLSAFTLYFRIVVLKEKKPTNFTEYLHV